MSPASKGETVAQSAFKTSGSASYPGGSGDVQVLHHLLEGGGLLRLFLVVQRDFFAEFARVV